MVARDIPYLTINTFLDVVVKKKISLLFLGWYQFSVVTGNRYLPRCSNGSALCITMPGNVFVCQLGNASDNYYLFWIYNDLLNSLNSVKFI